MHENINKFLDLVAQSLADGSFVKMTLSKPAQRNDDLRNIYVKTVMIRNELLYAFTYRYDRRDEVKNCNAQQMNERLAELVPQKFQNAVLFTVSSDITLLVSSKGNATVQTRKVQECRCRNLEHDNVKERLINPANPWWFCLGLTTREGKVLADMQHKYKQICRYTEIVGALLRDARFEGKVHVADMGAGKGYLTFALHEYLTRTLHLDVDMKGVEIRPDLVLKINEAIRATGLQGIEFVEGAINNYPVDGIDVLIALHACNTATDDAIAAGIKAGSKFIVCAPCCHKQIRGEMERSGIVNPITRWGVFMERQAVMITDTIRGLILEYFGYETQIMEFIDMEHTPKNVLLVGRKTARPADRAAIVGKIQSLKAAYGIGTHYLETILPIG